MTLLPTSACTHDCDQGDSCTCHTALPPASHAQGGMWIRIPDLILIGMVVLSIGIIFGVQLVKAGMMV